MQTIEEVMGKACALMSLVQLLLGNCTFTVLPGDKVLAGVTPIIMVLPEV